MNGIENFQAKQAHDPVMGLFGAEPEKDEPLSPQELAKVAAEEKFKRLWSIYLQELDRQTENRIQMAIDADYYDHIQWSEKEIDEMEERGQVPRVYNKIKPAIDWILGTEKRNRVDWKILPRLRASLDTAQAKTDVMKYVSDANHVQYVRSRAFADAVKVGIGWLTEAVEDGDDGEPLVLDTESWRNMLHDSANTSNDLEKGRYVIRTKWSDLDVACAMFPDTVATLKAALEKGFRVGGGQDSDDAMDAPEFSRENYGSITSGVVNLRDRIRLVEIWYKVPARGKFIKARGTRSDLNKEAYNPNNPDHIDAQKTGLVSVVERQYMQTRVAIMCNKGLLFDAASPYRHNRFPFTAIWGYRRDRDNMPYGVVRGVRDAQDDLNKRISKSLYILSTNKTIMDKGAVDDINEYVREVARPDAVIIKNPGKEIVINADRDLAAAHMQLMEMDAQMIQDASGITDENMGRQTNASSGRAIVARQDQGALATAELFDNLRLAIQISGEKTLSLVEQYYSEEKDVRLTDQKGNVQWRTINDGMPENDVARTRADFIVSQQDFRDSMMLAAQEQLMDMVSKMPPELSIQFMDMIVEMLPLPNKEEFVKRLRKLTGQPDPNQKLTPEEQAQQQEAQQAQQMQQQALAAQQQLTLKDMAAGVALKEAQTEKTLADAHAVEQTLGGAQGGIDPQQVQQLAEQHAQLQQDHAQAQQALQDKSAEIAQRHHTAVALAGIKAQTDLQKQQMANQAAERQAQVGALASAHQADQQGDLALQQQQAQHQQDLVMQDKQHALDTEQADASRQHEATLAEKQLAAQQATAKLAAQAKAKQATSKPAPKGK